MSPGDAPADRGDGSDADVSDADVSDADERAVTALAAARAGSAVAADHYRTDLPVEQKDGKTDLVTRADREAEVAVLDEIRERYPDDTIVAEESAGETAVPETGAAWVVDPIDGTNNFVREIPLWATAVAAVVDGDAVAAAVVLPAVGDAYVAGSQETRLVPVTDGGGERDSDVPAVGEVVTVSDRTDPEAMAVAPTIWWDMDQRDQYAAAASEVVHRFGDLARFRSAQVTLGMVAAGSLDGTFTNLTPNPWDSVAGAHLVECAGGTVTDLAGEPWRHDADGFVASNGHCHDEVLAAARAVADVADDADEN